MNPSCLLYNLDILDDLDGANDHDDSNNSYGSNDFDCSNLVDDPTDLVESLLTNFCTSMRYFHHLQKKFL